jgi:glucokinase
MVLYGIDLGGTTAKIGCFTEDGTLLRKWSITTDCTKQGRHILPDLARAIEADRSKNQISLEEILGIGLGLPGAVKDGLLLERCVNLGGWGGFDARKELSERMSLPVFAANDANLALLGEQWMGSAKGCNDVVLVTLGTGVGGAVMIGGHIREGCTGSAGEFGHIRVCEKEARTCGCGGHGCLEQYASAGGLCYLAERALSEHPLCPSALRDETLTPERIFSAAASGDGIAEKILDCYADFLGRGLAAAGCAYDPERFVLGGGLSGAGDALLSRVRASYGVYAFPAIQHTPICMAALGNDAGITGAARLVLTSAAR